MTGVPVPRVLSFRLHGHARAKICIPAQRIVEEEFFSSDCTGTQERKFVYVLKRIVKLKKKHVTSLNRVMVLKCLH
jgi:hypothetical protein